MAKVYVLLFHDVWNTGEDPGTDNENGLAEETTIEGVFTTRAAAEAGKSSIGGLNPAYAFYTIEEHDLREPVARPTGGTLFSHDSYYR